MPQQLRVISWLPLSLLVLSATACRGSITHVDFAANRPLHENLKADALLCEKLINTRAYEAESAQKKADIGVIFGGILTIGGGATAGIFQAAVDNSPENANLKLAATLTSIGVGAAGAIISLLTTQASDPPSVPLDRYGKAISEHGKARGRLIEDETIDDTEAKRHFVSCQNH